MYQITKKLKAFTHVFLLVALLFVAAPSVASAAEIAPHNPVGTCFVYEDGTYKESGPCGTVAGTEDIVDSGKAADSSTTSATQDVNGTPVSFATSCYDVRTNAGEKTISPTTCDKGNCSNLSNEAEAKTPAATCDLVQKYINPLINFLSALVGVVVVASIIIGGIQYSQSAGDPQKAAMAKNRIRNAIIALLVFFFLYALLNFLIPGGLL